MNVRRGVRFDVLADRVMRCRSAVAAAGWTSGPGVCGFRRMSRKRDLRPEAAKPAADPGGGEPVRGDRAFTGSASIIGVAAGQAELGVRGDDQPGPAVAGGRVTDLRGGPAE